MPRAFKWYEARVITKDKNTKGLEFGGTVLVRTTSISKVKELVKYCFENTPLQQDLKCLHGIDFYCGVIPAGSFNYYTQLSSAGKYKKPVGMHVSLGSGRMMSLINAADVELLPWEKLDHCVLHLKTVTLEYRIGFSETRAATWLP